MRDGAEVALTPKARDLLLAFLHNPGRLLTREDLVGLAWKDVAVTDGAVHFQIAKLREALGAEGESHLSENSRLVINTGTTIVTFLMVFLIQRAQNKDSQAIQLKLNELVAAIEGSSN